MLKGWGFFSRRGTILKNVSQKWKYFFFVLVFVQEKNNSKESNSFIQFGNHKIIMKEKMKKIWGCFTPCGFSSFFFCILLLHFVKPEIHRMSNCQISFHIFDHQTETMLCQFCMLIWIYPVAHRDTSHYCAPPHSFGMCRRNPHQRCCT